MIALSFASWLLAGLCVAPALVLAVECGCAALPSLGRTRSTQSGGRRARHPRPTIGVLIPAHNEEYVIRQTLRSVLPQLSERDRLLVVADNCSDATAAIAAEEGAEVLERRNDVLRGKGWALDAGRNAYRTAPPEALVIIDADTRIGESFFEIGVHQLLETGRPVQGNYLMWATDESGALSQVSSFAWLVKNFVRPLGLHRLGLPCLLNGSGMFFPWDVIEDAPLAGGHVGEEYKLAVDLTLAGFPPVFCPDAVVTGSLPTEHRVSMAQRKRWSHSHLQILQQCVPRLLTKSVCSFALSPLCLALDLAVPPLTILLAAQLVALLMTLFAAVFGAGAYPLVLAAVGAGLTLTSIALSWIRFGRSRLPNKTALALPAYAFRHAPHYFSFFRKRHTDWNKTPRETTADTLR